MADLLVDTNILIDAARGIQAAVDFLLQHSQESPPAISSITQMELLVGCRDKNDQRKVERFLGRFHTVKLTEPISDLAVPAGTGIAPGLPVD